MILITSPPCLLPGIQMMSFSFEPLKEDDLALMCNWLQEPLIKKYYGKGQCITLDEIKAKYMPRILGTKNVPSFIICSDEIPIGFIQYYLLTEHLPEGISGYENALFMQYDTSDMVGIDCFIANAVNRGKGLGSQLINKFIADLVRFRAVIVDPDQHNLQAINCYKKAGFKDTNYSEDPNYLVMIKKLL